MNKDRSLRIAKELHKPIIKKFERRRILPRAIDEIWTADLMILSKYSRTNNGNKYILNVIDTFSKFVWSVPLKTKTGPEVSKAFMNIVKSSGRHPNLLHTDKGTEFKNKEFRRVLDTYKIKLYHTENEEKSPIIERFNRTLNDKLRIVFEMNNNHKWINVLQKLINDYNYKDVHRTIKMTPAEVNKSNEKYLLQTIYFNEISKDSPAFKIGDRVRITRKKDTFGDKYESRWRREIFVIDKIQYTNPITYRIKDLKGEEIIGSFYKQELQKTIE